MPMDFPDAYTDTDMSNYNFLVGVANGDITTGDNNTVPNGEVYLAIEEIANGTIWYLASNVSENVQGVVSLNVVYDDSNIGLECKYEFTADAEDYLSFKAPQFNVFKTTLADNTRISVSADVTNHFINDMINNGVIFCSDTPNEVDLSTVYNKLDSIISKVDSNQTKIDTLQSGQASSTSTLNTTASQVNIINTRTNEIKSIVENIDCSGSGSGDCDLTGVNTKLDTLQSGLNSTTTKIDTINTTTSDTKLLVENIDCSGSSSGDCDLSAVNTKLDTLQTSSDLIKGVVDNNSGKIDNIDVGGNSMVVWSSISLNGSLGSNFKDDDIVTLEGFEGDYRVVSSIPVLISESVSSFVYILEDVSDVTRTLHVLSKAIEVKEKV